MDTTSEPQAIGDVVSTLVGGLASGDSQPFFSKNPDVQYLAAKSGLQPAFVRRMLGWFGDAVVLEALRRFSKDWAEPVFVGICRKVEREAQA